jgi:hypothetical protein
MDDSGTRDVGAVVLPGVSPEYRGKVRDIYDLGEMLIMVATR